MQTFMLFIGMVTLVIGVKLIYDARLIVNKYFSVNDKNRAVLFLKICGTFCAILGALLVSKNFGIIII